MAIDTALWPHNTCKEKYTQIITLWETLKQILRRVLWEDRIRQPTRLGGIKKCQDAVLNIGGASQGEKASDLSRASQVTLTRSSVQTTVM